MTIEDYTVTKGTAGDSPAGKRLLRRREQGEGDTCLDSAYLSREMCDLVNALKRGPVHLAQEKHRPQRKGEPYVGLDGQAVRGRP